MVVAGIGVCWFAGDVIWGAAVRDARIEGSVVFVLLFLFLSIEIGGAKKKKSEGFRKKRKKKKRPRRLVLETSLRIRSAIRVESLNKGAFSEGNRRSRTPREEMGFASFD